jgi:hypothetical protein
MKATWRDQSEQRVVDQEERPHSHATKFLSLPLSGLFAIVTELSFSSSENGSQEQDHFKKGFQKFIAF